MGIKPGPKRIAVSTGDPISVREIIKTHLKMFHL
jgi:hypothetical protein